MKLLFLSSAPAASSSTLRYVCAGSSRTDEETPPSPRHAPFSCNTPGGQRRGGAGLSEGGGAEGRRSTRGDQRRRTRRSSRGDQRRRRSREEEQQRGSERRRRRRSRGAEGLTLARLLRLAAAQRSSLADERLQSVQQDSSRQAGGLQQSFHRNLLQRDGQ